MIRLAKKGGMRLVLMSISRRLCLEECVCVYVSGFPDAEGDGNCLTTGEWTTLCIPGELPRR